MSLPEPRVENDFEGLIREALKTKASAQAPSGRVWRRIKRSLKFVSHTPGRFFTWRSSLVVHIAIVLLVLTLGGLNSQLRSTLQLIPTRTTYYSSSAGEAAATGQIPGAAASSLPLSQQEAYLFNAQLRRQLLAQDTPRNEHSPLVIPPTDVMPHLVHPPTTIRRTTAIIVIPPTDVIPHVDSPEGRLLVAEAAAPASPDLIAFLSYQLGAGVIK